MQSLLRISLSVLIVGLLVMRPVFSFADWDDHKGDWQGHNNTQAHGDQREHGDRHEQGDQRKHGDWHGRDHDYSHVNLGFTIWPNQEYYTPVYNPPATGVLVSPVVYEPVTVNGVTYYVNNGTYYVYNGYEYQAVQPPVVVQQPAGVAEVPAPAADTITINIPNKKDGYTPVTLKKSGNGYIGPQGEYYPEFPKVSQLEAIYGN